MNNQGILQFFWRSAIRYLVHSFIGEHIASLSLRRPVTLMVVPLACTLISSAENTFTACIGKEPHLQKASTEPWSEARPVVFGPQKWQVPRCTALSSQWNANVSGRERAEKKSHPGCVAKCRRYLTNCPSHRRCPIGCRKENERCTLEKEILLEPKAHKRGYNPLLNLKKRLRTRNEKVCKKKDP